MSNSVPIIFPYLLAQADAPPGGPSAFIQMLPLILLFVGMWFLIIAPQRKKQKEHQRMVQALQRGDSVMTSGGIFGEITSVKPDRVTVKIADNTKIEVAKTFIQAVTQGGAAGGSESDQRA